MSYYFFLERPRESDIKIKIWNKDWLRKKDVLDDLDEGNSWLNLFPPILFTDDKQYRSFLQNKK